MDIIKCNAYAEYPCFLGVIYIGIYREIIDIAIHIEAKTSTLAIYLAVFQKVHHSYGHHIGNKWI